MLATASVTVKSSSDSVRSIQRRSAASHALELASGTVGPAPETKVVSPRSSVRRCEPGAAWADAVGIGSRGSIISATVSERAFMTTPRPLDSDVL